MPCRSVDEYLTYVDFEPKYNNLATEARMRPSGRHLEPAAIQVRLQVLKFHIASDQALGWFAESYRRVFIILFYYLSKNLSCHKIRSRYRSYQVTYFDLGYAESQTDKGSISLWYKNSMRLNEITACKDSIHCLLAPQMIRSRITAWWFHVRVQCFITIWFT